jgi:hypothetical protein
VTRNRFYGRRWQSAPVIPTNGDFPLMWIPSRLPARLEPGVFGIFRSVLLVPEGIAERLTPEQFQAILAHEMCHVRRLDNLTSAVHMVVEAVSWFHPLIWWIGARIVEERELGCDAEVVRLGNDPEAYAAGILNVCRFYLSSPLACAPGGDRVGSEKANRGNHDEPYPDRSEPCKKDSRDRRRHCRPIRTSAA